MEKSLKDQNRLQLWISVAANTLFFFGIVQADAVRLDGLRAVFIDVHNLLPVGIALLITTVLNGVLSAGAKERLVFFRWHNALPGHRAFSKYCRSDSRIDVLALTRAFGSPFPVDPVEQNRAWYGIYKSVETETGVRQALRDYLLLRDYTALSVLFLIFYGGAGLFLIPSSKTGLIYLVLLLLQYVLVRQSASNSGVRLVTTALAQKAATGKSP